MTLTFGIEQIHRPVGGDVKQVGVADHAFNAVVDGEPRLVKGMGGVVVEFLVLFRRHILGHAGPDGGTFVEAFSALFPAACKRHRETDVIGIHLHDVFDARVFQEFLGVFF